MKQISFVITAIAVATILVSTTMMVMVNDQTLNEQEPFYPSPFFEDDPDPAVAYSNATEKTSEELSEFINRFCFDLYNEISDEDPSSNSFFSPYSIYVALAMTYEGANGDTAQEMYDTLGIPQNDAATLASFAELYEAFNTHSASSINTANALWPHKDYPFLAEYMDLLSSGYSAVSSELDYNNPRHAEEIIDSWVNNETHGKIPKLVSGLLDSSTRLVLTNAIHFNGTWKIAFDTENTTQQDFTRSDGSLITVDMMNIYDNREFNYTETDEFQILELLYDGGDTSMILVLPKNNDLDSCKANITYDTMAFWIDSLSSTELSSVSLPKFTCETSYDLGGMLADMGIEKAFSTDADFSKMDGTRNLFISKVVHKGFVDVNEEGTEAAAATAVIMKLTAYPGIEHYSFTADHPFVYTIYNKSTDTILFMGQMEDPSA